MARPTKAGLEYFPFDIDFFSDKKIKILQARYGARGVNLYIYLLCEIYKKGYYLEFDEDMEYILSSDLKMDINEVKQVINFLLIRSLFDYTLYISDKVLTSASIQKRFQNAIKTRALKNPIKVTKFWVLKEEETQSFIKCTLFEGNSENNESYSENNPSNSENNDTKESKVKESKVKNIKDIQCDFQKIVDVFNSICTSFPKVNKISESRKSLIAKLLSEGYSLDDFTAFFKKVESNDFLKGTSRNGWKANFDWLIDESNMTKVIEGNYDSSNNKSKKDIKNGFNNFNQRDYDYDDIERKVLEAQKRRTHG